VEAAPGKVLQSHPQKWLILALVLAAECMDLFDGTIVNVAAPTIRLDLHSSSTALQWIIGGYALTFAVGMVAGARLGDIYGRKRLFVIGATGFVLASLACALAGNSEMLISFRLVQGFAAALLIPQGLGIIRATFSTEELGSAFAIFGPVIGLSAVLGPILGGLLVDANLWGTGWRLVFLINLPLGLIAALGAARLFPESRVRPAPTLDLVGTVLVAAFAGLLIYPLIQGRDAGWPAWTYLMMVGGIVALVALVFWTKLRLRQGRDPLVLPSIFRARSYSAGLAMILVFFGGMTGSILVLTLFLQLGEGFSAIHAGLTLGPFAFGLAVGAGIGGAVLVPRIGRLALQLGAVVMAGGLVWTLLVVHSDGLHTSTGVLIAPQLVFGIGIGTLVAPLFNFILAGVADAEAGSASGVLNAVQQLAAAIGVAVIGTIFFSELAHAGFTSALTRCLIVELGTVPVLIALTFLLPQTPRDESELLGADGPQAEVEAASV
jgi:EmrB/QacA subfamily drug resistance transporter